MSITKAAVVIARAKPEAIQKKTDWIASPQAARNDAQSK